MTIINCLSLSEQFCTDSVNVYQRGNNEVDLNRTAIIPGHNFTCNGRITSIRARVWFNSGRNEYPFFQVWRPASVGSTIYNKVGEVQLQSNDQININSYRYGVVIIILTGNSTIEVQSGDVVGYYHPPDARYQVRTIQTDGYIQYQFNGLHESVDLNYNTNSDDQRKPLILFTIGKSVFNNFLFQDCYTQ